MDKPCNCNAVTLPHYHVPEGIRHATEQENKSASQGKVNLQTSGKFTEVAKG
jgi:hypothetical protein